MSDPDFSAILEGLRRLSPNQRKEAFAIIRRERETEKQDILDRSKLLPNSHWTKAHLLKRIPNPTTEAYEQKVHIPELTFMGVANQPDFGEVLLTFYPRDWTIELKSLKEYKDAFRDSLVSYERLANVMFDDLMQAYAPTRLRLMMKLRPRGGIASSLTIDSDWSIRGGKEQFRDWTGNTDAFGFDAGNAARIV
jgi:7-cyano-7-deazaguanine reductase